MIKYCYELNWWIRGPRWVCSLFDFFLAKLFFDFVALFVYHHSSVGRFMLEIFLLFLLDQRFAFFICILHFLFLLHSGRLLLTLGINQGITLKDLSLAPGMRQCPIPTDSHSFLCIHITVSLLIHSFLGATTQAMQVYGNNAQIKCVHWIP